MTPQGRQILVDGGPDIAGATRSLSGLIAPWDRSLDLVAATHLDADHSRGLLRVLETYRVDNVLAGVPDPENALYPQWQHTVERQGHTVTYVAAGQDHNPGRGYNPWKPCTRRPFPCAAQPGTPTITA